MFIFIYFKRYFSRQLVQGEEVLKIIENVPTHYESPKQEIKIVRCGEYTLSTEVEPTEKSMQQLEKYLSKVETKDDGTLVIKDEIDDRDVDSLTYETRLNEGFYCIDEDLKSHFPFLHLPDYLLLALLHEQDGEDGMSILIIVSYICH